MVKSNLSLSIGFSLLRQPFPERHPWPVTSNENISGWFPWLPRRGKKNPGFSDFSIWLSFSYTHPFLNSWQIFGGSQLSMQLSGRKQLDVGSWGLHRRAPLFMHCIFFSWKPWEFFTLCCLGKDGSPIKAKAMGNTLQYTLVYCRVEAINVHQRGENIRSVWSDEATVTFLE